MSQEYRGNLLCKLSYNAYGLASGQDLFTVHKFTEQEFEKFEREAKVVMAYDYGGERKSINIRRSHLEPQKKDGLQYFYNPQVGESYLPDGITQVQADSAQVQVPSEANRDTLAEFRESIVGDINAIHLGVDALSETGIALPKIFDEIVDKRLGELNLVISEIDKFIEECQE